ncbi:MAG: stage sporulation protein [Thermoanaerobacterium sp.]|nr:stage sporulation protein [Thermoanaerobacterium sp.]MDN5316515.1 stage sporulation protein [Thermoanaerobacterium sp.]
MMMRNKKAIILLIMFALMFLPFVKVNADDWSGKEGGYYTVYLDNSNKVLFRISWDLNVNDQYLSHDNKMYKIIKVDKKNDKAYAKYIETVKLPNIDIEKVSQVMAQKTGERKIAMYSTHSDESYIPTDGASSIYGHGGIYKVDASLSNALSNKGIKTFVDQTLYLPHDAMAYRRSRVGALKLLKNDKPDLLLDIHRDAAPYQDYIRKIGGTNATGVRLVLGRTNANLKANQDLAFRIKAIADKEYPNLVKDIFYGSGDYNQDLTPNSLLLEFGTDTHTRQRAEESAKFMADVLTKAVYGTDEKKQVGALTNTQKGTPSQNNSAGWGIWILIGVAVFSIVGFMFLSTGGREMIAKLKDATKKEFSSFLGKFNKDKK